MVPLERIELSTSPLPRVRSTPELQQHPACSERRGLWRHGRAFVKRRLGFGAAKRHIAAMADKDEKARRLAEELRKNLRRRKAQSREQQEDGASEKT